MEPHYSANGQKVQYLTDGRPVVVIDVISGEFMVEEVVITDHGVEFREGKRFLTKTLYATEEGAKRVANADPAAEQELKNPQILVNIDDAEQQMDLAKGAQNFQIIAGESIGVEEISGAIYAFGSELATLRLFKEYAYAVAGDRARQGYSENRETFYFRFEPRFSENQL